MTEVENKYRLGGAEEVRRRTLKRIVWYTCGLAGIWVVLHMALEAWTVTIPVVSYLALSLINLWALRLTKNYDRFRTIQLVLILTHPLLTQLGYGGFSSGGAIVIASFIGPLGALMFHRSEVARWFYFGFAGVVVLAAVLEALGLTFESGIPREANLALFAVNIVFLTAVIYFALEKFWMERDELADRLEAQNIELQKAMESLQATQKQLVVQEKMASLGRLTAGIAHEIKNPLNFITNFAGVSVELIEELSHSNAEESAEILGDLRVNVAKIHEHGRRADRIVQSMLQHSRGGAGERREVDLNRFLEEYANLAYHGMKAQVQELKLTLNTRFGENVGMVDLVPQDIGRVLLNLLNNAFYAVRQKELKDGSDYEPTVEIETRRSGDGVEIIVRDNGEGIPPEVQTRIFEPFFTTKPTGSGTGLGLSLSYDIIVGEHGGSMTLKSESGKGTEFIVWLPAS
ncbi:MAG: ATP-binding protein [Rhodothermales bacterium]